MRLLFDEYIKPLITNKKIVVEIGAEHGHVTNKLKDMNFEKLITIDPSCNFDSTPNFTFIKDISLNYLKTLTNNSVDVFLVDGDHNWYTVYNELNIIKDKLKPDGIIFCHDTKYPWARRDMYYNKQNIPKEFLHEICKLFGFDCSNKENGEKNGVLTAIEDFIKENTTFKVDYIDYEFGLAIIRRVDNV